MEGCAEPTIRSSGAEDFVDSGLLDVRGSSLNVHALDLTIFDEERIALGAAVAEEGRSIEAQVEGVGEVAGSVCEKVDLGEIC